MFFALLLMFACGPATPDTTERTTIEQGSRAQEVTTEPWIRNAKVHCDDGWWDMHMSVQGVATTAEWVMDLEVEGEPHRMVADGFGPEGRLQDWTNESPYNPEKNYQVETHLPCQVGLNHLIWIQGETGTRAADCVVLGPDAEDLAADTDVGAGCVALSYDDRWGF